MPVVLRVCPALLLARPALTGEARLAAQDATASQDTTPARRYGHFHIGLTIHDNGLSVGNAPRVNGMRLNVQDAELERVNGVNITLWKPREPLSGTVNGLQLGVVPGSREVSSIAVALGGVVAERRLRWISVGGLGTVSNGPMGGRGIGGLGLVGDAASCGVAVAVL